MIGIFGGTFDPVHYGHLRTAVEFGQLLGLDSIRFVLSASPPHRDTPGASAALRWRMLEAALADWPDLVADDREYKREGPSWMVETLASIRAEFPDQSLCLILGQDAFNKLDEWHQWQRLFELAHIGVASRPGAESAVSAAVQHEFQQREVKSPAELAKKPAGYIICHPVTRLAISATGIRQMAGQGADIRFLLPPGVCKIIEENQIYTNRL